MNIKKYDETNQLSDCKWVGDRGKVEDWGWWIMEITNIETK